MSEIDKVKEIDNEKEINCPVCACPIEENDGECGGNVKICPACDTPHHNDCWEYNEGCAIYGCSSTLLPEKITDDSCSDSPENNFALVADVEGKNLRESKNKQHIPLERFVFEEISEKSLLFILISNYRVLIPSLLFINFVVFLQAKSVAPFLLCVIVTAIVSFMLAFANSFFRSKVMFKPGFNLLQKETYVGPFKVNSVNISLSDFNSVQIGTALVEHGNEHREMLRLVCEKQTGQKEVLYLDVNNQQLTSEDISSWALMLHKRTDLEVLKSPLAKAGLLQKRITAFELHLDKATNCLGDLQPYWGKRYLLILPYIILFPSLATIVVPTLFSAFTLLFCTLLLTLLYSFFRPEDLYNFIKGVFTGRKSYLSPEPEPLMFYSEESSIAKLSSFMTRVEESHFISLIDEKERYVLSVIIKTVVVVPLILLFITFLTSMAGIGTFLHSVFLIVLSLSMMVFPTSIVLFAMLGGAINRGQWNEEWARGWLKDSKTAINRLEEYKASEREKEQKKKQLNEDNDLVIEKR